MIRNLGAGGLSTRPPMSASMQAAMQQLAALDPDLLTAAVQTLAQLVNMSATQNSIALVVRNSDNTAGAQEIPLTNAGTYQLVIDASGNVTLASAPSVTPIRTSSLTLDATVAVGTVKQITFGTAMPDANYIVVPVMNGLAGSYAVVAGSQTANGYQVKITGLIVGTVSPVAIHTA